MSEVHHLTGASDRLRPRVCRGCSWWQQDPRTREVDRARWIEEFEERFGSWGKLYLDGERHIGSLQYGPALAFPRSATLPAGPPSDDAMLVTCAYLSDPSSPWALQSLFLACLGESKDRGAPAVEAFAYVYDQREEFATRFLQHRTIFPRDFLADLGFWSLRIDGRVELMRLELGGLLEVPSEGIVAELVRRAREALVRPEPARLRGRGPVDYRDVLATVVGASVAGIIAFAIRLIFPVNAAVLALIYAATYSLLWSIVGDHAKLLFHRYLPASTRLDGHWRLVTGSIALLAAACAGLIVAVAVSSRSSFSNSATTETTPRLITRTVKLQPRVVVNKKTIVMPVETTIVTTPVQAVTGGATTMFSRTVVVQRPPITVTVASTRRARTQTVTETTPAVTAPETTTLESTTLDTTTTPAATQPTVPPAATETVPTGLPTGTAAAP